MEFKDLQFKATADPLRGELSGFAAVYGNVDEGNDRIVAGASRKTIAERLAKIKICWNHDLDDAWAKVTALQEVPKSALPPEVLREAPDATGGLYMEAKAPLTQQNIDRLTLIAEGVKDGLSIGYEAVDHEFKSEGGRRIREIKQLKLYEISVVTLGMNAAALVTGVKSQQGQRQRLSRKASGETFTYTMQRLNDALQAAYPHRSGYGYYDQPMMAVDQDGPGCAIQDVYTDAVVVCDQDYDAYWEIPYSMAANGTVTLGTPAQVKITYAKVPAGGPEGMEQMGVSSNAQVATTVAVPEQKAPESTASQNDLPDSAFAVISAGGHKDDEGKTTPRSLRHLPHHKADGSIDLPHLRNALARVSQTDLSADDKAKAERHLEAHARAEGVGDADKGETIDLETKRGARHSSADYAHMQAMHDHLHRLMNLPPHGSDDDASESGDAMADDDQKTAVLARLTKARLASLLRNG